MIFDIIENLTKEQINELYDSLNEENSVLLSGYCTWYVECDNGRRGEHHPPSGATEAQSGCYGAYGGCYYYGSGGYAAPDICGSGNKGKSCKTGAYIE